MINIKKENSIKSIGLMLFIFSIALCCINDLIAKKLSSNLSIFQITFLKYFFGSITIFICLISKKNKTIHCRFSSNIAIRTIILLMANYLWFHGLKSTSLFEAAQANYTIPFAIIFLSYILRREKTSANHILATALSFIGAMLPFESTYSINMGYLILMASALLYALIDVINKIFIDRYKPLDILIQTTIGISIISAPFAFFNWNDVSILDLFLLFCMGGLSNTILIFILQAYKTHSASDLAHYHYLEMIIAAALGYMFFDDVLGWTELTGGLLILSGIAINKKREKANLEATAQE